MRRTFDSEYLIRGTVHFAIAFVVFTLIAVRQPTHRGRRLAAPDEQPTG